MKITSLELWCSNLDEQNNFYTQLLGLPALESKPGRLTLRVGQSSLTFHQAAAQDSNRYHVAFDIPENQFDPAFAWLQARVPPATSADGRIIFDHTDWNATSVYFFDPAGNIMELIARHNLPPHNQPSAAGSSFTAGSNFAAASLVSITEFGIACQDVRASVQSVVNHLGVTVFDGASSDTFSAVGDEQGLLILVQRGRIWMPDAGFSAEFHPFSLQVQNQAGQHLTLSAPPYPLEIG